MPKDKSLTVRNTQIKPKSIKKSKHLKKAAIVRPSTAKTSSLKLSKKASSKTIRTSSSQAKAKTSHKSSAQIFDVNGKLKGEINLPKEIFGQKPNEKLLTQALRVYSQNQHLRTASTKTRAQVRGGGRKPYRQKGTGRARAGSIRSPLWVGGGVVFGPKPVEKKLKLPKKMKRKALISALSQKMIEGNIKVISNFGKIEPKTKVVSNLFKKLDISGNTLLILEKDQKNVHLAVRNLPKINITAPENLNPYKILVNKNLILSKEVIEKIK